jgi:hypothetical protein
LIEARYKGKMPNFEISENYGSFDTYIDLFEEEKIVWTCLVDFENFGHQECNFRKKLLKIRENVFSKQVLDFV